MWAATESSGQDNTVRSIRARSITMASNSASRLGSSNRRRISAACGASSALRTPAAAAAGVAFSTLAAR